MIVSSDISTHNTTEMIDFYRGQFDVVEVVSCSKCKEQLALQLQGGDPMGMQMNELGKIMIPISEKLVSHRIRLDEAPNGEPMIGYQCLCGNDTRISAIEEEYMPEGPENVMPTALDPFSKSKIREAIRLRKDHKPKFKVQGKIKQFETFKVERIK